jgi:cytochrome c-type biogenesis protein CcmH
VQRLAERMQAQPEDPQGWRLLGRAYAGLQRYELARDAYREAVQRSAPDPDLLADYADALASTLDGKLEGEPERLALQALGLNPDQPKALALAGSAAFERGDGRAALAHWTRARRLAPDGSPFAQGLDAGIREASVLAGLAPPAAAQPAAQAAAHSASAAAPGAGLQVKVQLAPALAARVQPGDTLFVFARAAEGSRMPLAVARLPAGAGPLQVRLDDGSAMSPQTRLSSQSQVVVGARISRSGDATPQAGDLEGESAPVAASGQVELLIDRVRP